MKLIERIFNKYNDLATKKGHQVHEIMRRMSDVVTMRDSLKLRPNDQMDDEEQPNEVETTNQEDIWDDLHEFTARPPSDNEKPLYKVFVEAMVQKQEVERG